MDLIAFRLAVQTPAEVIDWISGRLVDRKIASRGMVLSIASWTDIEFIPGGKPLVESETRQIVELVDQPAADETLNGFTGRLYRHMVMELDVNHLRRSKSVSRSRQYG